MAPGTIRPVGPLKPIYLTGYRQGSVDIVPALQQLPLAARVDHEAYVGAGRFDGLRRQIDSHRR